MTIVATERMQRAFEDAMEGGRITRDALDYAVANGYAQETIDKLRKGIKAKVAQSRVRLTIQGAPLLYREPEPLRNPTDPTPEWLERGGKRVTSVTIGKGEYIAQKSFMLRGLLDQYAKQIGQVRKAAGERFVFDACYKLRARIANWEPSGAGNPNRLGGIGNRPQHERQAVARHEWVMRHLCPEAKLAAKYLLTAEILNQDGSLPTFEDFGRKITPETKLKHRLWGEGFGVLWLLTSELVHLYSICPVESRPVGEDERWTELGYETKPRHAAAFVMPQ